MKKILNLILFISLVSTYSCSSQVNPDITGEELKAHIDFLAGEQLKGRSPGTAEDSILMKFISDEFKSYGLEFFNESGIQSFDFISNSKQGDSNSILINGSEQGNSLDFMPFSFSSNAEVDAPLVFAGYGIDFKNDTLNYNDYQDLNVTGKWVLVFRGNPLSVDQKNALSGVEKDRDKAMLAKDKGAAGIIMVSGSKFDVRDELNAMSVNFSEVGIPCFQITRTFADKILLSDGKSVSKLEDELFQKKVNNSFELKTRIKGISEVVLQKTKTGNVIAWLKGSDPVLSEEFIVIGAHHDHLGMGGQGNSSRVPDTIAVHYGADDNASGVAAVLELAEKYSRLKPSRSIIFATFGAEEKGIIGSNYFVSHPPVPLDKIELMLNLDMVGRLRDSSVQIGGVGTSAEFKSILSETEKKSPFHFSLSEAGYGPSDHAAFYAKDKPVLFFSTGAHQDYHTPDDKADSINIEGLKDITLYLSDLSLYFANNKTGLTFQEAGPKESTSGRYRGKVTFGIMPDVSGEGNEGMKVLAVTEGKPAANGGLKKGDVITAIDGKAVGNIQDYMFRLGQLKPGERTVVSINRAGVRLELLIQL